MKIYVIPDPLSMVLTLVATLILFFVLTKLLYKPVSKMLNDRKERIKQNIDGANNLKQEAAKLKEEYELKITEAKKEAQEIIEEAEKEEKSLKKA